MFLEPLYLNESMLLNCASYLFGGVVTNKEKTVSNNKDNATRGKANGTASSNLGISLFSDLLNASVELEGEIERKNIQTTETKATSQITLGAIHQSVLEELKSQSLIFNLTHNNMNKCKNENKFIKLKATLEPIDYFDILQIFKLIIPQLGNFFELFGTSIFPEDSNNINEQKTKVIDSLSLISDLVKQLEKTYLESNQLEMLMIDEETGLTIGVIDIDLMSSDTNLTKHNPNEIKSKLTDGSFIIIGKVTKLVNKDESINLLQRSLLSTINNKLEIIINFFDINMATEDVDQDSELSLTGMQKWNKFKETIMPLLKELFILKISGEAIRMKALSICI